MKRKPAKRKAAKRSPPKGVAPKSLIELWNRTPDGPFGLIPSYVVGAIDGIPLPADLDAVIGFHANEYMIGLADRMEYEPWFYWWLEMAFDGEHFDFGCAGVEKKYPRYHFYSNRDERWPGWPPPPPRIAENGDDLSDPSGWKSRSMQLSEYQRFAVGVAVRDAMLEGYFLAVLRYADDLKTSSEAAPVLEALKQGRNKGGEARRKKAEPIHKEVKRRFKELRKTVPKKTARYLRVAEEFGISDRHVARIVDGLD
jgi:hypothetical protein